MASDDIEREKLKFEVKKWQESLALENRKICVERWKAGLSTGAIVIPLLIVAATIYTNTRAQQRESQAAFELKVAEVILQTRTVTEAQNRADGLVALFPERLPRDFSKRLDPLTQKLQVQGIDKRALLNLLVNSPKERRQEIVDLWLMFYPEDREHLPTDLRSRVGHQ